MSINKVIIVFILLIFLFPTVSSEQVQHNVNDIAEKFGVHQSYYGPSGVSALFRKTYLVEMRDGIKLATDVYRPFFRGTPRGSILLRTPYTKDALTGVGGLFSFCGWPTVIQDVRGRYASGGDYSVFLTENTDGPDTLAWIANQSWSNGKVGTLGPSALGIPQYFMAGENPSNLACQFIIDATSNLHKDAVFQGGQLRKSLIEGWLEGQGSLHLLDEVIAHENASSSYWLNVTLEDKWGDVNVPAIHMGGWFDIFVEGIIDGFRGYQYQGGAGARGKSKLIIGPWVHVGSITREQGELVYPINSLGFFGLGLFRKMIREYTLDKSIGYDGWPAVSYYVMGAVDEFGAPGNVWRYADAWPVPVTNRSWFLHSDGGLKTSVASEGVLTFQYDPLDPVPTIGGQNLNIKDGPYDQRIIEDRDDVLVFSSSVLEEPYEVTGRVEARLFVSSDCVDTDFTVKLTDVYPDGRSMLITDGILRMRNRNGSDHWEFMEPGSVYEVLVNVGSTSYIWNAGHQIRVAISSSNYPRFLNNPNTADGIMQNESYVVANNSVFCNSVYPSSIVFPEI